MQIEGTLEKADDAISIGAINEIDPKAPPPGDYLVDDKFGLDAFKQKQARRYSSFLERGGKIRTVDGKEYDGVVYFFNSEDAALKARDGMKGLNPNIYIGFYDNSGNLKWLLRSKQ